VLNLQPERLGLSTDADLPMIQVFGGPEYFRVMQLPLRAGRLLDETDVADAPPVFVVNETLARTLGGTEPALRRCLRTRDRGCARIVGVVADARFFQPLEEPWPAIYGALAQYTWVGAPASARLVVRTDGPVDELAGSIRQVLVGLGSEIQFVDVRSISSLLAPDLQPWRVATLVFTLFGTLSFVLAAGGLYAVVAYLVAARKHEIGVRIALGARPLRILRMVLVESTLLAVIGGTAGVLIAGAVSRLLAHRMYGVRLADPLTYALVAVLVTAVALTASLSSARRATKIDPALALRSD
jgi:putative ABC transport system permease protein